MTDTVQEFGQILTDKRIAKVAGIEVDVSRLPSRFTLEVMKLQNSKIDDSVAFEKMIDLIARICQLDKKEITTDFILDNLDVAEITLLYRYITDPVNEKARAIQAQAQAGEGTEEKNG